MRTVLLAKSPVWPLNSPPNNQTVYQTLLPREAGFSIAEEYEL